MPQGIVLWATPSVEVGQRLTARGPVSVEAGPVPGRGRGPEHLHRPGASPEPLAIALPLALDAHPVGAGRRGFQVREKRPFATCAVLRSAAAGVDHDPAALGRRASRGPAIRTALPTHDVRGGHMRLRLRAHVHAAVRRYAVSIGAAAASVDVRVAVAGSISRARHQAGEAWGLTRVRNSPRVGVAPPGLPVPRRGAACGSRQLVRRSGAATRAASPLSDRGMRRRSAPRGLGAAPSRDRCVGGQRGEAAGLRLTTAWRLLAPQAGVACCPLLSLPAEAAGQQRVPGRLAGVAPIRPGSDSLTSRRGRLGANSVRVCDSGHTLHSLGRCTRA